MGAAVPDVSVGDDRHVMDGNVMAVPQDKQYVMLNGLKYPVLAFRRPYYEMAGFKELAQADPFHPAPAKENPPAQLGAGGSRRGIG